MTDLVTLEDFKDYTKKTSPEDDGKLQSIVSGVSQIVKNYCQRSFIDYYEDPKTETFNIASDRVSDIFVTEVPVVEVVKLEQRRGIISDWEELTEGSFQFLVEDEIGRIIRINEANGSYGYFPEGPQTVRITYKAGYEEIPEDLRLVIFDLINYYFKNEKIPRKTFQNVTKENSTTTGVSGRASFPDHITRILDLYKL